MTTINVQVPEALLLNPVQTVAELERRSQFLLALKFFELGELTSGQSSKMCGMSRIDFLTEASRLGVPVADLSPEEIAGEFGDA